MVDATPYGKDLLKPLAEACRRHGLKLGFYYSQAQDWTQGGNTDRKPPWDPAQPTDMDAYLRDIAAPQVKEILSNYGDIAVLWWDTNWDMNRARADLLIPELALQPGIISQQPPGRRVRRRHQDPRAAHPRYRLARRLGVVHDHESTRGGSRATTTTGSPTETLVRNLIDIASKGGNYLLNVGPTAEGEIPAAERRAPAGHRRVDERARRSHLRHHRQPLPHPRLGPYHDKSGR